MKENMFEQLDFGSFKEYIDDENITDISYTNNGQIWIRSLDKGSYRVENDKINNAMVEKLAFQCSNVMGTTFNNASPFLDAESPELRMNFVHESIATNGIALVIRKTPAKIRLKEENLLQEDYITKDIHDFLMKCVLGHCNIIVCGETGSGKTEFVKYLASHTQENEKIITIEDTLELHLDRIYPHRDIVSMKTNNIASYSDVLVTCMRQNPKWILLSEVRSSEAVSAVRNSISSGHNILSTIHSDKASAIPHRMYSLMETDLDVDQFLNTIYRYVQLGVHIKAYYSPKYGKFHREIDEITEFYIDEDNKPVYNTIYHKTMTGKVVKKSPSSHLLDYLLGQNIDVRGLIDVDNTSSDANSGVNLDKIVELEADNKNPTDSDLLVDNNKTLVNNENNSISNVLNGISDFEKNNISSPTVNNSIPIQTLNDIKPVVNNSVLENNDILKPIVNEPVNIPNNTLDNIKPVDNSSINQTIVNDFVNIPNNQKPVDNTNVLNNIESLINNSSTDNSNVSIPVASEPVNNLNNIPSNQQVSVNNTISDQLIPAQNPFKPNDSSNQSSFFSFNLNNENM